jgi:hypothetical protein
MKIIQKKQMELLEIKKEKKNKNPQSKSEG